MSYTATRITERFYEYTDGIDPDTPGDVFNIDAEPHTVRIESETFDTAAELVDAMRRDYVTFAAYGDGKRATDPDGSHIIDYATVERETITWDVSGISPRLLGRVIVPAVDARP